MIVRRKRVDEFEVIVVDVLAALAEGFGDEFVSR
jgi:hypothetical protein